MKISVCPKCYKKGIIVEGTLHLSGYQLYTSQNYRCSKCEEIYEERIAG